MNRILFLIFTLLFAAVLTFGSFVINNAGKCCDQLFAAGWPIPFYGSSGGITGSLVNTIRYDALLIDYIFWVAFCLIVFVPLYYSHYFYKYHKLVKKHRSGDFFNLSKVTLPPHTVYSRHFIVIFLCVTLLLLLLTDLSLLLLTHKQDTKIVSLKTFILANPTPTPDLYTEASRSATADWKIYTSTKYGYTFKYPSSVTLTEMNHQTYLKNNFRDASLNLNASYVILEAYGGKLIIIPNAGGRGMNPLKRNEITIDGKKTEKVYETDTIGLILQIPDNKNSYSLQFDFYLSKEKNERQEFDKLIDQILSTFKFQ